MKKGTSHTPAFTLVEVIVTIMIFSMIMVSVIQIFIHMTQVSQKIDLNRMMQENIKNTVEMIADDIRKYGMQGVSQNYTDSCSGPTNSLYKEGNKLCIDALNTQYYLAKKNLLSGDYSRIDMANVGTDCGDINDHCELIRQRGSDIEPLTNSNVSVKDLIFYYSDTVIPKLTIIMTLQPSQASGVRGGLIKENKLQFQTTLSQREFN